MVSNTARWSVPEKLPKKHYLWLERKIKNARYVTYIYIYYIVAKSHGLGVTLTENYLIQQLMSEMKKLP